MKSKFLYPINPVSLMETPRQIKDRTFAFGVEYQAKALAKAGYLAEATEVRCREARYRLTQEYLRMMWGLGLADYHPQGIIEKSDYGYSIRKAPPNTFLTMKEFMAITNPNNEPTVGEVLRALRQQAPPPRVHPNTVNDSNTDHSDDDLEWWQL